MELRERELDYQGQEVQETVALSPYMNKVHRVGRVSSAIAILTFIGVGLAICLRFDIMPSAGEILAGGGAFFVLTLITGIVEFVAFLPKLGPGATYLSFITGNISNMKLPSVMATMAALDVDRDSEEHEILATIATCVAALLVIVLITIVIIFSGAMAPFLEWEPIQPAFANVLPAIFGILAVSSLKSRPKVSIFALAFGILYSLNMNPAIVPVTLPLMSSIVAVAFARILFKWEERKENK